MSDENINPQNISLEAPDPNLTDPKPPFLNSKKIAFFVLFLLVILIFSSFWYLNQIEKTSSTLIPTVTPIMSKMPIPTQRTNELIFVLRLNETIKIPDTKLKITYMGSDVPGESCFDCVESDSLEVKFNDHSKILDYSCGGITGKCTTLLEAFGYKIEIIDRPGKDILKLRIIRK